jgi:hypothetical protein
MRARTGFVHKISHISQSGSAAILMLHQILQFLDKIREIVGHAMKWKVNVETGFDIHRLSYRQCFVEPINVDKWGMLVRRTDGVAR